MRRELPLVAPALRASSEEPAAAAASCAVDRSCGCGSTMTEQAIAVGCTLPTDQISDRGEEFRQLFARGLRHREATRARAVWIFAWSPELERDARALAAAEQGCCSFWRFELRRQADELIWEASVPDDRLDAIAMLDDIAAAIPLPTAADR